MPQTRILRHVHLETDCHCPTETVPTEAERLRKALRGLLDAIDNEQDELSPELFAAYSAAANELHA